MRTRMCVMLIIRRSACSFYEAKGTFYHSLSHPNEVSAWNAWRGGSKGWRLAVLMVGATSLVIGLGVLFLVDADVPKKVFSPQQLSNPADQVSQNCISKYMTYVR